MFLLSNMSALGSEDGLRPMICLNSLEDNNSLRVNLSAVSAILVTDINLNGSLKNIIACPCVLAVLVKNFL